MGGEDARDVMGDWAWEAGSMSCGADYPLRNDVMPLLRVCHEVKKLLPSLVHKHVQNLHPHDTWIKIRNTFIHLQ